MKNKKLLRAPDIMTDRAGLKPDYILLAVTMILVAFGILMVYSASMYSAQKNYGSEYYFMFKQLVGAVLGFVAMTALTFTDYHILGKLRYIILGGSLVLLVLVFIPGVGVENYGARRWINLPFFTLQASEFAKFGFIIFTAFYMSKHHKKMTTFTGVLPVLAVGALICVLIILEPNMSITICMALLMFVMLFVGGMRIKHFLIVGVPAVLAAVVLVFAEPYRLNRLMAFLNGHRRSKRAFNSYSRFILSEAAAFSGWGCSIPDKSFYSCPFPKAILF